MTVPRQPDETRGRPEMPPAGGPRPPSQKRLRELLRTSPLVSPELRGHWLRVLPHLTDGQRSELAALLTADESADSPPTP